MIERRLPASDWDFSPGDWWNSDAGCDADHFKETLLRQPRFFFSPSKLPRASSATEICRQANRILAGKWPYFSHSWFQIGLPPDWRRNPLDGMRADHEGHWSKLGYRGERTGSEEVGPAGGDIKFVWEPSRFSVVYLLVRAYAANFDERYAEGFWSLIEDWAAKNPPNTGVNWVSGQEAALRVMAWCFGLYGVLNADVSRAERIFKLLRMTEAHGERIAGFIEYALSQRNNHGISEGVGLFTIGILFPQLRRASEWTETGQRLIVAQLCEQVYEDGSYIQHSFDYQRVLID